MTDRYEPVDEPGSDRSAALDSLLADADLWDDPPADLADSIVAAIEAESRPGDRPHLLPVAGTGQPGRRSQRRLPARWMLAAAAAAVAVIAGAAIVARFTDDGAGPADDTLEIALAGTPAAPGATAAVVMSATPAGLKIVLDPDGLAPAPEGHYYEAWIGDGTIKISAGGFHLRGGVGPIALWAGVADPAFTELAVTLEPVDGDPTSSGDVRLFGEFDLTPLVDPESSR